MNALIIDTSKAPITVMIIKDNKYIVNIGKRTNKVGREVLPLIDTSLKENALSLSKLDCLGVINGTGSFTGIRVGVSTINAIKFALKIPLIEINTLEYLLHGRDKGVSVVPTGRGEFFTLEKEGSFLKYSVLTKAELDLINTLPIYPSENNFEDLYNCFVYKFKNKNFVNMSAPLYLKGTYAD